MSEGGAGPGDGDGPSGAARGGGAAAGDAAAIPVRLTMPDRWLEHVAELPRSTSVAEAKSLGLRAMLLRATDDPSDFYCEYAEKRIRNEGLTLEDLGVEPYEALSIRAYDLGHYPSFPG